MAGVFVRPVLVALVVVLAVFRAPAGAQTLPVVTVTASTPTANELGPTSGAFTVSRTGSTANSLTVFYSITGTATSGVDYVPLCAGCVTSGNVFIPIGQSSATIAVTPVDDGLVEANETVTVTINTSTAYSIGTPRSATVSIVSDDASAVASQTVTFDFEEFTATQFCGFGGSRFTSLTTTRASLVATVTRPGSVFDVCVTSGQAGFGARSLDPFAQATSNTPFVVNFSAQLSDILVDMGDFGQDADSLRLDAFSGPDATGILLGTATASLPSVNCSFPCPFDSRTLRVTAAGIRSIRMIGGSSGNPNSVIYDNLVATFTPPVVTIANSTGKAAEGGPNATITVTRTGSTAQPLTVNYTVGGTATPGSDYQTLPGSVTISAGQTTGTFTVVPIDDTLAEPDETVVLTLAPNAAYVVGSPGTVTVPIASNDPPTVTIAATSPTATEVGPTPGVFTVTRTGPTDGSLTVAYAVSGTATAGSDYVSLPGTVTIPVGAASATITVTPINDTLVEPNETVVVTLSPTQAYLVGTPGTATVTIVSDDAAPTVTATISVAKAGTGAGTVTSSPAGISCGTTCSAPFTSGTSVNLVASAAPGSVFAGWGAGVCSQAGPTCTVALGTTDVAVTATFSPAPTLTVGKTGTGTGTVTSSPAGINCGPSCSTSFASATLVTLTASAAADSVFDGWSGGGCSGTGTCTVNVTGVTAVTATFTLAAAPPVTLTVVKAGTATGTVTSAPAGIDCGTACAASFPGGTEVVLTAAPAPGAVFSGWSGGGCSGAQPCRITVTAATTVTATFAPGSVTLTVARTGTGSGTVTSVPAGIDCGPTCAGSFASATSVTLTATAAPGSIFGGWSGGGCSGVDSCTVVLAASTTVEAAFSLQAATQVTLTVTKAGTGTGTVASVPVGITCGPVCAAAFDERTPVTLTATPAADSTFMGWSGACSGTGPCALTLTAATAVTATFRSNVAGASLVAAVLPTSRTVTVGTAATVFATMINLGPDDGLACAVSPGASLPATFSYQPTDPATNQVVGVANTPMPVAAGATQSLLLSLTPNSPVAPIELTFVFKCTNSPPAPSNSGLNTLVFAASAAPAPDAVALAATVENTGIVDIPGVAGTGVFSVASINVGAEGVLTVSADTGSVVLPVAVTLCQTDPRSGACVSAVQTRIPTKLEAGATPTFAVFVQGTGIVPFDPANHRVFVRFRDDAGVTRGATSVALRTILTGAAGQ
jgi:hypothetical protein